MEPASRLEHAVHGWTPISGWISLHAVCRAPRLAVGDFLPNFRWMGTGFVEGPDRKVSENDCFEREMVLAVIDDEA